MGTVLNYITCPLREISVRWICEALWYLFSAIFSCPEDTGVIRNCGQSSGCWSSLWLVPFHSCCPRWAQKVAWDSSAPLLLQPYEQGQVPFHKVKCFVAIHHCLCFIAVSHLEQQFQGRKRKTQPKLVPFSNSSPPTLCCPVRQVADSFRTG